MLRAIPATELQDISTCLVSIRDSGSRCWCPLLLDVHDVAAGACYPRVFGSETDGPYWTPCIKYSHRFLTRTIAAVNRWALGRAAAGLAA
eukprot:6736080-Pyramimonas_sp.AAC.1